MTNNADRIKPIETLLAGSLSNYRITKGLDSQPAQTDQPFGFNYSFEALELCEKAPAICYSFARACSGLSRKASWKRPSRGNFPIEFEGPVQDTDTFQITLPPGYTVDDLPPPVDADFGFASYHSKTELKGNVIGYTRTFEVKDLSVPVSKSDDLKEVL